MIACCLAVFLMSPVGLMAEAQDGPEQESGEAGPVLSEGEVEEVSSEKVRAPDLDFFVGCWQRVGAEEGSGEWWTLPAGGTLLGLARSVREGRTTGYEFLRVEERESVGLVYIAVPSGQRETEFPLAHWEPGLARFENPDHDFPQRVVYRRNGADGLSVRAETLGTAEEPPGGFTVDLRRRDCGPVSP
ncbi:MAG: DUF6265 family protein [Acidobacteriota bacterium]